MVDTGSYGVHTLCNYWQATAYRRNPMLQRLVNGPTATEVQETAFSLDVLGRYLCNTYDEAVNNGGFPFDAIVIGAGMFGAYTAEKIYRMGGGNLRVLVLDAGSFLVSEHLQNLSRIGLNPAKPVAVDPGIPRDRVWGLPWRGNIAFPGLAYCIGGRSLYWGGWAPRLTDADLAQWPASLRTYLAANYGDTEKEIGVDPVTDFISGPLFDVLLARMQTAAAAVASVDAVQDAPLAVQGQAPAPGLFGFDKFSSAPILCDAIREASAAPDSSRRLFLVPRTHVTKLLTNGGRVTSIELSTNGQAKSLPVPPACAVVVAISTIESTRLALESFPTAGMGANLMGHLRSNTIVRIKRSAFAAALPAALAPAAMIVRGSTPQGRYHLQVTAAAVGGADSEATMWRMVPDLDLLQALENSQQADKITITLRGIGEMVGDPASGPAKAGSSWIDLSPFESDEFGARRAYVNLVTTPADLALWNVMDTAAIALAQKVAGAPANIEYFYDNVWNAGPPPAGKVRDGLGTTHHEAGTLPIGTVTDPDGKFQHIANAYAAGPAIFPQLGSANPSLTALTLARRTAAAIVQRAIPAPPAGQSSLIQAGLEGWQMAGSGSFVAIGNRTIESRDGIGLLWYTKQEFSDFVLTVDWRAASIFDNSGVFIRFPALGNADPTNDWRLAVAQGYEVQIDQRGFDPNTNRTGSPLHQTGAIYELASASATRSNPLGEWNTFEITATGSTIVVKLNGLEVSRLSGDSSRPLRGHIGLQNHHPGSRVQFRNLMLRSTGAALSAGAGQGARPLGV